MVVALLLARLLEGALLLLLATLLLAGSLMATPLVLSP